VYILGRVYGGDEFKEREWSRAFYPTDRRSSKFIHVHPPCRLRVHGSRRGREGHTKIQMLGKASELALGFVELTPN
jgi:hypothetical protein